MLPPEYFPDSELACHCGCGLLPDPRDVLRLYALRILWGHALPVTSAARCARHNRAVGGKPGSLHLPPGSRRGTSPILSGQGWDIHMPPSDQMAFVVLASRCGFTGFGFGRTYIHIDDGHPHVLHWVYKKS